MKNSTPLTEQLQASFELAVAAEEQKYADRGIKTMRLLGSLHQATTAPVLVIESHAPEQRAWCASAEGLAPDHPARTASPGESYSFKMRDVHDHRRRIVQEQSFIGTFDTIADLRNPVTGDRVSLLAEHPSA